MIDRLAGPWQKLGLVLGPREDTRFSCPFAGQVAWEAKDVFNPAAVVRDGRVHLLYRAEDFEGRFAGTSRIGLAISDDGVHFERETQPVFFPARDGFEGYEWEGGCEDPRVVESPDGGYVMTYTAYDGKTARLCVATSPDLRTWTKHGLAFGEGHRDLWCKSGAVVTELRGDRLVASRIDGLFWMFFGEHFLHAATSADLVHWSPVLMDAAHERSPVRGIERPVFASVMWRTPGEHLLEPGPPAVREGDRIALLYHRVGLGRTPVGVYRVFLAEMDTADPTSVIFRSRTAALEPSEPYELDGQNGEVTFAEGLVWFNDSWLLYYGTADSEIAVAKA